METISANLSDLNSAQLIQLNQGLGRQIDKLRADRLHLKTLIAARIAAGDNATEATEAAPGALSAFAPGAVLETKAT